MTLSLTPTSQWEEDPKTGSYKRLENECRSKGWSVNILYVEVAVLGQARTTWGMMSKVVGMKRAGYHDFMLTSGM